MFTKTATTFQSDIPDKSVATINNLSKQKAKADYREKWLKKMEFLNSISAQTNAVILLYDTSVNRFLYMSDTPKILGNYNPEDFTSATGVDFSFHNIHPEQRSAALLIQLQIMSYGMDHPLACLNNCVANMTFLYKRKTGEYFQFLQKAMVVETDPSGYPLLYLYYGFDTSHLVRPSVGLIINAPDETLIWAYNTNKKSLERVNLLSRQEKKILGLLAQGKHSKEIGDMLFISSHTIDTHRRNLLKKTNCIDSTALITFAKMTGLI